MVNSLQRKEMAETRLLQYQPVLSVEPILNKSYIEEPIFFNDYPSSKIVLERRFFLKIRIENIGNGPAITVDVIPDLLLCDKEGKVQVVTHGGDKIGPIKQNQELEHRIVFTDNGGKPEIAEYMMGAYLKREEPCKGESNFSHIRLKIYYRNFLGVFFKQEIYYKITFFEEDDTTIRGHLKFLQSIDIDFAKEIEKANALFKIDYEKSDALRKKMNDKLIKRPEFGKTFFDCISLYEKLRIKQISAKEYEKDTNIPYIIKPASYRNEPKEMELDYEAHFSQPIERKDEKLNVKT